jgi:hypothetical protein
MFTTQRLLVLFCAVAFTACQPTADAAQDEVIASAESAAPASISATATIQDWDGNVLREGTNGWTCLPDRPDAYVNKTEPTYTSVGVAYMLQGDTPVSNTDPYATAPTSEEDWVTGLGPHLMIVVPDRAALEGISTDPYNGGPWIMWPDTPYAHSRRGDRISCRVSRWPRERPEPGNGQGGA